MNNKKDISLIFDDYCNMIFKSWTWERLTKEEKDRFLGFIYDFKKEIKGTYNQRWNQLHLLYHSFLIGLNYKPIGWREEEKPTF